MALIKKLTQIGGSKGLVLSKDVLAQLGFADGEAGSVQLVMVGDTLLVRRAAAPQAHPAAVAFAAGMPLGDALSLFAPDGEPANALEREAQAKTNAWLEKEFGLG